MELLIKNVTAVTMDPENPVVEDVYKRQARSRWARWITAWRPC